VLGADRPGRRWRARPRRRLPITRPTGAPPRHKDGTEPHRGREHPSAERAAGGPALADHRSAHLYQLQASPTTPTCSRRAVPAVRVDHGGQLPGPAFRIGWYGGDLARLVWTSRGAGRYSGGEDRPAGIDGVAPGSEPDRADTDWPPGSYLLRWMPPPGCRAMCRSRSARLGGRRVVLVSAVTSYQAYNGWGAYSLYGGPGGARQPRPPGHL